VGASGLSAEAYLMAGQFALNLNEFERADRDADAALKLNPNLPGVYTLKGQALQYMSDHPGAIEALRKALEQNDQDFDAHLTLGAVLNTQRDLESARTHLEKALQLRPNSTLARYELAKIQRTQGQLDDALGNFEQVVKEEPKWLQPHIELAALYYKMKRPADGQRERALVDQLTEDQHKAQIGGRPMVADPTVPKPISQ
jgi:tetratricopeptide (TPR) repeat protein